VRKTHQQARDSFELKWWFLLCLALFLLAVVFCFAWFCLVVSFAAAFKAFFLSFPYSLPAFLFSFSSNFSAFLAAFKSLRMSGLAAFDQKNSIEATTPINTALKICFSRRKNGLLNRLPSGVKFLCF
jgi:hypothetical protein